jgi:hypothetical protein
VVLPQPDGPSSEKNSPFRIVTDTSASASTAPNLRTKPRASTAMAEPSPPVAGELSICTGFRVPDLQGCENDKLKESAFVAGNQT